MQRQKRDDRPYIKKIEFAFFNEKEIRLSILDARGATMTPELRNGSGLPDPTAREAICNLSPIPMIRVKGIDLKFPESWMLVVDKTYNWCKRQGEEYYEATRLKYKNEFYVKICSKLDITISRFYEIIERARIYAALQAAQMNLIHVE